MTSRYVYFQVVLLHFDSPAPQDRSYDRFLDWITKTLSLSTFSFSYSYRFWGPLLAVILNWYKSFSLFHILCVVIVNPNHTVKSTIILIFLLFGPVCIISYPLWRYDTFVIYIKRRRESRIKKRKKEKKELIVVIIIIIIIKFL